jgi:hypothetical protein
MTAGNPMGRFLCPAAALLSGLADAAAQDRYAGIVRAVAIAGMEQARE